MVEQQLSLDKTPGVVKVEGRLIMQYCNRFDLYRVEASYDDQGRLVSQDAIVVQENCPSCIEEILG